MKLKIRPQTTLKDRIKVGKNGKMLIKSRLRIKNNSFVGKKGQRKKRFFRRAYREIINLKFRSLLQNS